MTQELKQTLKNKLNKLYCIFKWLIREKDDNKRNILISYFLQRELPEIQYSVQDYLKRIKNCIEMSIMQRQYEYQDENKQNHVENVSSVINEAQNQLLSNIDPLALFKNHPNLMPFIKLNKKITRYSLIRQNSTNKKTSIKVNVQELIQSASRMRNSVASQGTVNFEYCNPINSINFWNSILHNDFNVKKRVKKPEISPGQGDQIVLGRQISIWSTESDSFVRYSLDQTIPSFYYGIIYDSRNKPKLQKSCYLKCVSCKAGMLDSQIVSIFYSLQGQKQAVPTKDIYFKRAGQAANKENFVSRPVGPRGRSSKLDLGLSLHTPSLGEGTPAQTPGVHSSYKTPNTPGASSSYYQPNLKRQSSASVRSQNNYDDNDQDEEINI